jgi:hypothetical protein
MASDPSCWPKRSPEVSTLVRVRAGIRVRARARARVRLRLRVSGGG